MEATLPDVRVLEAQNIVGAIVQVMNNRDIDLVLSDYTLPDGNAAELYNSIIEINPDIPFMIITGFPEKVQQDPVLKIFAVDNPANRLFIKPLKIEDLVLAVKDFVGNVSTGEFCKVDILRLQDVKVVIADVYLKLSENKYLKVIPEKSAVDWPRLEKYYAKGVEFLYVRQEQFDQFSKLYSTVLNIKAMKSKS